MFSADCGAAERTETRSHNCRKIRMGLSESFPSDKAKGRTRGKADRICSEDDPRLSVSSRAWLYSMLIKKPVDQSCCLTFRRPPFFAQTLPGQPH